MVELGSGWTFRGKVYTWPNTRSHAPQQRARRRGQLIGESRPSRLRQPRTFRSVEKLGIVAGLPRVKNPGPPQEAANSIARNESAPLWSSDHLTSGPRV